ncbi:MAG: OsmC family protein [Candidatus Bathyarchaeota archaeon]|nr:OsmC family protein [Candidatus Bathyarchaeota archaeon]MDH5733750.1 OsmC family protein [Candidatus Bathyarchaeota archaeon]
MIKAVAKWEEDFRLRVDNSRGHSVVCDLPVATGGDNAGPTALELAVMALASCAVTVFVKVCKQSKTELSEFEVVAEAEKHPGSSKLAEMNIKATASAKAGKQLLEAAWRRTEANCPVLLVYQEPTLLNVKFDAIPE